jgi:hypothetical protein
MSNLTLQFPEQLLEDAQILAQREHLSLEEYVLRILSEQIAGEANWRRLVERGRNVTKERFLEILRKAPDVPPQPGDEIE